MLGSLPNLSIKKVLSLMDESKNEEILDDDMEQEVDMEDTTELTLLDLFYRDDSEALIDRLTYCAITQEELCQTDEEGLNILTAAVVHGEEKIVKLVLEKLDYKRLPNYSYQPIYYAVYYNHIEILKILLENITEINLAQTDQEGSNLLHVAVEEDALEIFEMLLNRGALVNSVNHEGKTPLHVAAHRCNYLAVKTLLQHGAYVNQRDANGDTPMHLVACTSENVKDALKTMDLLAMAGADFTIKNNNDQNILSVCSVDEIHSRIEKEISYRHHFPLHTVARFMDEKPLREQLHQVAGGELFEGIQWTGRYKLGDEWSEASFLLKIFATPSDKSFKFRFVGSGIDDVGPSTLSGEWHINDTITISQCGGIYGEFTGTFNSTTSLMVGTFSAGYAEGDIEFKIPLWPCTQCNQMIPLPQAVCAQCAPKSLDQEITEVWIADKRIKLEQSLDLITKEINKRDQDGRTAIMCAAMYGRPKILSILLPFVPRESLKEKDKDGKTALDHVLGRKLVCNGSTEEESNNDTLDCMEILCKIGNLEVDYSIIPNMEHLEKKHQFCHGDCQSTEKSLTDLARQKNWVAIDVCLRDPELSDRSINVLDHYGKSILHYICENGKIRLLKLLAERKKFNLNLLTQNHEYPLFLAAKHQKINMIHTLLNAGADPSTLISPDHPDYFRFGKKQFGLLDGGEALRLLKDKAYLKKKSPLYYLARVRDIEEAVNLENDKESALHVAVKYKLPLDVLRCIIEESLDIVFQENQKGETPLIIAARMGSLDHVKCLLDYNAKVDQQNKFGKTALMYAAVAGHKAVVQALLDGLADIDIEDYNGNTVLDILDAYLVKYTGKKKKHKVATQRAQSKPIVTEYELGQIKDLIKTEDVKRQTSVEYRKKLTIALVDLDVVDAFEGNGFAKAINCSPVLGRSFLNECVSMDRHQLTFKHLDVLYGARVRGSALYSVLNMNTQDEELIYEAKTECLEHVVMRRIMEIKWELFAQRKYIESLLVYLLLLCTMTISSILFNGHKQDPSTIEFAIAFGIVIVIFTTTSYFMVQCLRPRILWCLARYGYDGSLHFEPKEKIPDLPRYKSWAKRQLLYLTIFITVVLSTLCCVMLSHFNLDRYFMVFNNLVLAMSSLYFVVTEFHELRAAGWSYFNDIINCTQSFVYLLIVAFFVPMKLGLYGTIDLAIQIGFGGFITIFLWILFLQFLEVVPNASYLLPMISKLMRDVWNFFLFLAVFQVGITITYYQIFVNKDDDAFSSLSQSFFTTYFVLFGQFPTDSLSAFNNTLQAPNKSFTGEHFLYLFAVILMMFHAAAITIILMNMLLASMNKTVDGGLERAHTEALASYGKAILRLEMSNYSKVENEKLMYLDIKQKVLNPIFTQPIHKAKLKITPQQEDMIQKHLDATTSRHQQVDHLYSQVVDAYDTIQYGLDHIGHFTKLPVLEIFQQEYNIIQKWRTEQQLFFSNLKKCRDLLAVLENYKKLYKKAMVDVSKALHDIWNPDNDTSNHARCVMLYQMVHKRDLSTTILVIYQTISEYFDGAIREAQLAKQQEPKINELLVLIESLSEKNKAMQTKLDMMDQRQSQSHLDMLARMDQLVANVYDTKKE